MIFVAAFFIIFFNCLIEFILSFFLGSSSTTDGIEYTFQNILDDYDDEEESDVTMMEESGDSF